MHCGPYGTARAQITAFEDTWHWNVIAEETYRDLLTQGPEHASKMIGALRDVIGTNEMMAYLVMMTARLVELHRVLKATGSLYLHCDPTAAHYLKIILDVIFGIKNLSSRTCNLLIDETYVMEMEYSFVLSMKREQRNVSYVSTHGI